MTEASKRIADLSPKELAAFAKKLSSKKEGKKPELVPVARDGREFPLSFPQQRLWFLHQLDPESPAYNLANFLRLEGAPDFAALRQALDAVVERHEIFRTTYAERDGKPVQVIHPKLPIDLPVFDFSSVSEDHLESEGIRLLKLEMTRPFDLAEGPMLRSLVIIWRDRFYWGFGYHHIVSDWWSSAIFFREVLHLYEHFTQGTVPPLPEASLQYADYALWQRRKLDDRTIERHIEAWKRKLGTRPPILQLPTDRPRPVVPSGKGRKIRRTLPSALVDDLADWSRQEGATLFMALLAAFKVLLKRYSGQNEISVGSVSANRDHPDIQNILGFFVNTLVFHTDLAGRPTFRQLLGRVKASCLDAFSRQDLPFEKLVAALQPEREANRNPLFQVMFSLETPGEAPVEISQREGREQMLEKVNTKFDLTIIVVQQPDRTSIDFEYSLDLFDASTAGRMSNQLRLLLQELVRVPDEKISHLPLLAPAERHQLLWGWNDTQGDFPPLGIHQVFSQQATATPAASALIQADATPFVVSYGELQRRSRRLAHYLKRCGVAPGDLVGLVMERSAEVILSMLGILEAGAGFVPLDPTLPAERLALMAQGVSVVVTHRQSAPTLRSIGCRPETLLGAPAGGAQRRETPPPPPASPIPPVDCAPSSKPPRGFPAGILKRLIRVEEEAESIAAENSEALELEHFPGTPMYVMFTSGSTGRPKGVVVEHGNVLRLVREARFAPVSGDDTLLQLAPLSFDASTFEIWASLLHGAALVIHPPATPSLEELGRTLQQQRITTLWLTAGLFHLMVDERLGDLGTVRQLLAGGDVLSPTHIERLLTAHPECTVINGYGPTENTTFTACHRMTGRRSETSQTTAIPIGRPIDGTRTFIVSEGDEMAPIGVPGELVAGGAGVASHYHLSPALTAEHFVPDAWSGQPGARVYRTGDRARWLPNGRIAFLGRLDDQVKIRGFRVEPRETEIALCRHETVQDAVVLALPEPTGGKRLVAYVQAAEGQVLQLDEVREQLAQSLPEYMLPAAYVVLERFPLNSNGKVDRRALPAPEGEDLDAAEYEAPQNPTETFLVSLWEKLLGVSGLGIHADFFHLGGHSLLATQAVSRIRGELDREIALRDFFEHATPSSLAAHLGGFETAGKALPPLVATTQEGPLPLSFAQQRLWFLHQLEPHSAAYNMADSLVFTEELNIAALERALGELVARHGSLRTRFETVSGQAFQVVEEDLPLALERHDLRNQPRSEQEAALNALLNGEARRPFDLARGPLLRVLLAHLERAEQKTCHVLFFNMHHIISDGWSLGVFVRELQALYQAFQAGLPSPLEPLPIQYVDYAAWQRNWLRGEFLAHQLAYWKKHLQGAPQVQLPSDRPRPALQSFAGAALTRQLPPSLARDLDHFSGRQGVTSFMTFLTGFGTLLSRYSGQDDLVLGSPIANRTRTETENLIGFFVNTLVLRLDLTGGVDSSTLMQRVRELTLGAYDHQDLPFETLVDELQVPRDLSRNPLFQILFDFHTEKTEHTERTDPTQGADSIPQAAADDSGGRLAKQLGEVDIDNAICDLSLSIFAAGDRVLLGAQYSTALFDATTIDRMLRHFENLLEAATQTPTVPVHHLPMLSRAEVWQSLGEWSGQLTDRPEEGLAVTEGLQAQALRSPEAMAVAAEEGVVSYGTLLQRAHGLAHRLRGAGVRRETTVGLLLGRSIEMIVAVVAVLEAGGVYVPLDPEDPADRLRAMVDDAGPEVLLVDQTTHSVAQGSIAPSSMELLTLPLGTAPQSEAPRVDLVPSQLAFCIYTSGSTGRPKGVQVSHRALTSYVTAARRGLAPTANDRVLQFATLSFDVTVEEIFLTLLGGATLVLASDPQTLDYAGFDQLVRRQRLTSFELPTHYWSEWVADLTRRGEFLPPSLRYVMTGTERALPERLEQWCGLSADTASVPLLHVYGLTETTVTSLTYRFEDQPRLAEGYRIPIGRPLVNTTAFLLDRGMAPLPPGVAGEIYLGGEGLARGYLNRPRITAERFVPNPFSHRPGARLYRTGDLAHGNPDGNVVFLGRVDSQVKIRGFRIEPGEIEAALLHHEALAEAVVWLENRTTEDRRLVAYLVCKEGVTAPSVSEWHRFLRQRLPEYMIPGAFVVLESMPLTARGKIDFQALPAPESDRPELETHYTAPRGELERDIAKVWCEVLQLDQVGIHDNFFELGGNSLLIAQVHGRLREELALEVTLVDLFTAPTIHALAAAGSDSEEGAGEQTDGTSAKGRRDSTEVAVIGMVGRFSGTHHLDEFWDHIKDGVDDVQRFTAEELIAAGVDPDLVALPEYIGAKGVLPDADLFDATFFELPPREAEVIDPQHRIFLQLAWASLEQAGYDAEQTDARIGVYAGCSPDYYFRENLFQNPVAESMDPLKVDFGNVSDFLPLRVSYALDLEGPSVNVQTACSTSLTAIAEAYFSLLDGQCDMALAGGVSVLVPQISGYIYHEDNIWSSDGHCRSFDAKADGLVTGEGAGIVVLKRLDDALADGDQIHAVIKGAAVRNEGAAKVGFAAPGVEGQVKMVRSALDMAGVPAETIGLVEAHGSATNLGDPAEVTALTRAWRASATRGRGFCALGSVKSNIGHADIAAGVAGFLKATLSLRDQVIPPSLHFESPNPQADLENSPFYVPTELKPWELRNGTPRRAGVGSLGVGGTNAHLILEEAPERPSSGPSRTHHLLVLSAKTSTALAQAAENLAEHLEAHPELPLADVAYTLGVGRRAMAHRRFIVAEHPAEAISALRTKATRKIFSSQVPQRQEPPVLAFMLSGEGSLYPLAGKDLYREEAPFRESVDRCSEILQPILGWDLRNLLYPTAEEKSKAAEELAQPHLALPALFVVNYSLATLWRSWGLHPHLLIGHGPSELVAACLAEVLSLEDALTLSATRGRLLGALPEAGALAVSLPHEDVAPLLDDDLVIREINGPYHCVVYGTLEAIESLEIRLDEEQADHRRLSGRRSVATENTRQAFLDEVRRVSLREPQIPLISCLSGTRMTAEQAQSAEYWADQLLGVMRFAEGIREILDRDHLTLLEIGPGRTLTPLARQQVDRQRNPLLLTSLRRPREDVSDVSFALATLGRLWLHGVPGKWADLYADQQRRRVPLPAYPFEGQRFWIDPPDRTEALSASSDAPSLGKNPSMEHWFYAPSWHRAPAPGRLTKAPKGSSPWLLFQDPMGFSKQLARELRALGYEVVTVQAGGGFAELDDLHYAIHPGRRSDYETLAEELHEQGLAPGHIVHLWNVLPDESDIPGLERFEGGLESGYYSLLLLLQTLRSLRIPGDPHLMVVSNNMQEVHGSEPLHPEKATLLGICRVLSQEHPHLSASSVDVMVPPAASPRRRRLAQNLILECLSPARELAVAWRGDLRWVQTFEPVELGLPLEAQTCLRKRGVYLITGGQGYLGFELGSLLARKYEARLALVGHSALPPRGDWDRWLEEHEGEDDKVSWKIGAVRRLEEEGAEVLLLTADASDQIQMADAFQKTLEHFGELHGVLHAAGITDETYYHPIAETLPENCRLHFAPKIEGLCVLEELLSQQEVDFCLVFSSIASILGGLGFVNYTAANAVLDTWVQRLNRESSCHWVAVSWDGWLTTEELVEAAGESEADSLLALAMTMEEGLQVTERILARPDLGHVVVSTGDLEQRIDRWVRLESLQDSDSGSGTEETVTAHSRPELSNAYEAPRNELEGEVAEIWQRLLGIDQVGIYDNFFEMGGDSLLAVHLSSKIHQALGVEVTGGSLLAAQTVAEQAVMIVQKMAEEAGDEDLAEILAESE